MRDNKMHSLEFVSGVIFPGLAEELSSLMALLKERQTDRLSMLLLYEGNPFVDNISSRLSKLEKAPHHNLIDIKRKKLKIQNEDLLLAAMGCRADIEFILNQIPIDTYPQLHHKLGSILDLLQTDVKDKLFPAIFDSLQLLVDKISVLR
tara:strand:+ start:3442 stop:3888 length:447 start_codon:yes stop_codon:yes gene_type:complete